MNKDANQDLFASHAVINYLLAGYQGSHAYLHALSRLSATTFEAEKLESTKKRVEKILGWKSNLLRGECLFSANWETAQTFEAQTALKFCEELQLELAEIAKLIDSKIIKKLEELELEDLKFFCASLARFFYTKENYMRGYVELAQAHKLAELEQRYGPFLAASTEELKLPHDFIKALKQLSTELPRELSGALRYQNMRMPGVFRGQAHELNQLVWRYKGKFDYSCLNIDQELEQRWTELSIPPQIAGYWIGYGITPDEAIAWNQIGMGNHEIAAAWRLHGFKPDNALPWFQANFAPAAAWQWASAGLSAEQAIERIKEQQKIQRLTKKD